MDILTSQALRRTLPLFTALAVGVLVLVIATILFFGREIFVPFALAVLLSFALAPIVNALQRLHIPQGLAIACAVLVTLVLLAGIGTVIANQLASLVADIPSYRSTMQNKLQSIASSTEGHGPIGRAVSTLQDLTKDFETLGSHGSAQTTVESRPMTVTLDNGGGGTFETVSSIVSPLLHPLATVGIVLIFAIFILGQREDLRNRFIRLAGIGDLQQTTAAIDDAARRLGRLLLTQVALNAAFGVIIGLGLWAIGVPTPFLWGTLGGILRFVPYIGAVIGAALPLALAFAVDPGWSMVIWTVVLFATVEPVLGHIIEPLLYGHSSGLSPIAVILAAAIWAFLWGPVGLVLATPLTICLVVMGRYVPRLSFIDIMLGDRPALSPPQLFYQRMLAGSVREAAEQAHEFLRERALATYYDEIALEGLRLAHEDVARFAVKDARLETLRGSTLALVHRVGALRRRAAKTRSGLLNAEAAAAVDAVGPDSRASRTIRSKTDLAPGWRGEDAVVCIAGESALDEPIAAMLTQVLSRQGFGARYLTLADIAGREPTPADAAGVALVCLSFLEPLSTVHLRYAVRRVHRAAPDARILIAIWRQRDPATIADLRRKIHADALATTLNSALAAVLEMSAAPPSAHDDNVRRKIATLPESRLPAGRPSPATIDAN